MAEAHASQKADAEPDSIMANVSQPSSTGEANAGKVNTDKNSTGQNTEPTYCLTHAATTSTQQLVSTFERAFGNMATYASGYSNYQPAAAATNLPHPRRAHSVQTQHRATQHGGGHQTVPNHPATRGFRAADRRPWGPVRSVRNREEWGDAVLVRNGEENGPNLRAAQRGGR